MSFEKDYKLLYGTILNLWLKYCYDEIPRVDEAIAIPTLSVMSTQLFNTFSKKTKLPIQKDYFNNSYTDNH